MIRIQSMEAYWNDIQKIARSLKEYNEPIDDKFYQAAVKSLASFAIYLDVQRAVYKIPDKEMDDAIRSELYRHLKEINEREKTEIDENLKKSFATAHECCSGCVD